MRILIQQIFHILKSLFLKNFFARVKIRGQITYEFYISPTYLEGKEINNFWIKTSVKFYTCQDLLLRLRDGGVCQSHLHLIMTHRVAGRPTRPLGCCGTFANPHWAFGMRRMGHSSCDGDCPLNCVLTRPDLPGKIEVIWKFSIIDF